MDVSLYATPWIVTIFAASFPLGFVVRVLDLVFLEGKGALLKVMLAHSVLSSIFGHYNNIQVAISLLTRVEGDLLAAESFEQVILAIFYCFVRTLILPR